MLGLIPPWFRPIRNKGELIRGILDFFERCFLVMLGEHRLFVLPTLASLNDVQQAMPFEKQISLHIQQFIKYKYKIDYIFLNMNLNM